MGKLLKNLIRDLYRNHNFFLLIVFCLFRLFSFSFFHSNRNGVWKNALLVYKRYLYFYNLNTQETADIRMLNSLHRILLISTKNTRLIHRAVHSECVILRYEAINSIINSRRNFYGEAFQNFFILTFSSARIFHLESI